jgi:hypothetical protein
MWMDIYKEIMNDWNYDARCVLASLLVSDLEHCKHLIFVSHSVRGVIDITQTQLHVG